MTIEKSTESVELYLGVMKQLGVKVKKTFDPAKHRAMLEACEHVTLCAGKVSPRGECSVIALGGNEKQRGIVLDALQSLVKEDSVGYCRKPESIRLDFAGIRSRKQARIVG